MPASAPQNTDEMIARLPLRIKNGGWTTTDIDALESGRVAFDHFLDGAARLRLCTAAGYFNRTLIVTGPVEGIPAFEVVPAQTLKNRGHNVPGDFNRIFIDNDDDIPGLLRASAAWSLRVLQGGQFNVSSADSIMTQRCNGPIEQNKAWFVQTETGGVAVFGAKETAYLDAGRDGVMAFLAAPGVVDHLKR